MYPSNRLIPLTAEVSWALRPRMSASKGRGIGDLWVSVTYEPTPTARPILPWIPRNHRASIRGDIPRIVREHGGHAPLPPNVHHCRGTGGGHFWWQPKKVKGSRKLVKKVKHTWVVPPPTLDQAVALLSLPHSYITAIAR